MLFNSYQFIFLFLPVVLLGYFLLASIGNVAPVIWLALASLAFYSLSNWQFVLLLLASIAFNYAIGLLLVSTRPVRVPRFAILTIGVAVDLVTLGYFKYAGFLAANLNAIFATGLTLDVLLPVGISFYTFTQIAFLVDAYRGHVAHYALPPYALCVTYFPHLIAGPILHHGDMIPQFERAEAKRPDPHLILCGVIIFAIGLFKKTCLADDIQPLVLLAFGPNASTFDQAWISALAYTFQLYFDFSGYSDMAIGISLMFGIFLPVNFNSPYKATSIIDFWRRWHMTLSQFLRDYLYIPLGGNRRGPVLRYVNLAITMVLGGLWHGAAWTFVVWGALHGAYLCINHAWNRFGPAVAPRFPTPRRCRGIRPDLPVRRRRLGILSRRQHGDRDLCFVEDCESHADHIWPRGDGLQHPHLSLCVVGVVRAEHAGDHGLRSQEPHRRRGVAKLAEAYGLSLCRRGCAGFRDSGSPAAQRIHLFQVLMSSITRDLLRLLCATAAIILGAVALNFVVDPLQFFRPARLFPAMYSPDSRLQNAGLIRSQNFDTLFMGTSLAIHFRQSDIDRILGVRSLKLAMAGSNSREQNFVLAAALERHPKRVIWQFDDWILRDTPDIDSNKHLPADLYRGTPKGIAEYLFSGAMARESAWILARAIPPLEPVVARLTSDLVFKFPVSSVDDINSLAPDFNIPAAYNQSKAVAAFTYITDPVRSKYLAADYDYDTMVRRFEQDVIALIAANPGVRFDLYLPPYSILHFVAMRDASPEALKVVFDFFRLCQPAIDPASKCHPA